jgi:hypothetical protein
MISSLNPTIWRDGSPDAREWKMMFWSACIEISEEVLASNLMISAERTSASKGLTRPE